MLSNFSNHIAAGFAAIFSAAVFVGASIVPATNSAASLVI